MSLVCYYTCNLVPPGFLERADVRSRALLPVTADGDGPISASTLSILPHSNTCPYVVRVLAQAETTLGADDSALLVIPTGCDAMRRAGDTLKARFGRRVFPYVVPRANDPGAVTALARDLDTLAAWLEEAAAGVPRAPADAARAAADAAQPSTDAFHPGGATCAASHVTSSHIPEAEGTFDYPRPPRPGGVYVVGGPQSRGTLLEFLEGTGISVSGAETCRGPECGALLRDLGRPGLGTREIARALLDTPACPRSGARARLDYLRKRLHETQAAAVLYARLPFCDPGAYDALAVRGLARECQLPFMEIEVGYPLEIDGPLRVRIEAFVETISLDDSLLDDEEETEPESAAPLHDMAVAAVAGARAPAEGAPDRSAGGPLSATLTRRALATKSAVAAIRSGTARRHLEHHALRASLDLYKPRAFVPWVSYLFPPEIAASYGLIPLIPEIAATALTGTDFREQVETAMNRQGLSRDVCSYHRAAKAALDANLLPPPSICLGTTPLCLGKECMLDAVAMERGVPFFSVRVPLPPDQGPAPRDAVDEVAEQLRELHARLGELAGRRAKLEQAVGYSNRASAVWSEVCAERLSGRLLWNGRQAFAFTFLGQVLWGTEMGARGFEKLRDERGRRDLNLGVPGPTRARGDVNGSGNGGSRRSPHGDRAEGTPRPRLLWLHTMPHHDRALFDLIAERGGAVVFEEMSQVHLEPLDPADPFSGMARRLIEHPLWGSATRRARLVLDLVRRGDIDGVIHFNHWGCRHGLGTLPVLRDSLGAAGVPFLALDGDALDQPGHASDNALRQLETFLEIL
ncbi:MAG: 2-hydroxyacyl-CoA dehydratase [Thermoleophilia bacterium]